ncbi:MAG: AfsA-related hotdog domain-containing protein [Magnetospirillum sp.]|nr:AfsA-related hotdog domain-containing protein [Magnetospirillum sp.]
MPSKLTIVVGDRFQQFARNPHVQPVSEFLTGARGGASTAPMVVLGQGLSRQTVEEIGTLPLRYAAAPQPANSALTHKRAEKNIMVSMPRATSERQFEADLFLDDRNEVMEDHQTGQHIQGLALIEAARQLWTAVAERFFLPPGAKVRFVIDSIRADFAGFVFPLPCRMTLDVVEVVHAPLQRLFTVHIVMRQNAHDTTMIDARFRVIDDRVSERQEMLAARKAIEETVASAAASA